MSQISDPGILKDLVLTWANRAAMARKQKADNRDRHQVMDELTGQALDHCWEYQTALAPILNVDTPPKPDSPEEVWQWLGGIDIGPSGRGPDLPRAPDQPAGVPRKPLPFSGAGAVALPLPDEEPEPD
jgi:hypothetical protein